MPNKRGASTAPPAGRYTRFGSDAARDPLSWGSVHPDVLSETIAAVTDQGDALLFGRTSDGGALSLRVLSGGQTYSEYFATIELAQKGLGRILQDAKA